MIELNLQRHYTVLRSEKYPLSTGNLCRQKYIINNTFGNIKISYLVMFSCNI